MVASGVFSLEDYCSWFAQQGTNNWSHLPEPSQTFLETLNLSVIPPICHKNTTLPEDVPPMGPLLVHDHHDTILDAVVTLWLQTTPALLAMGELWLRLLSFILAPLCIGHLLWDHMTYAKLPRNGHMSRIWAGVSSVLAVTSCVVLTTDACYVLQYGPQFGYSLLIFSAILALKESFRYKLYPIVFYVMLLLGLTVFLSWDPSLGSFHFGGSNIPLSVKEGLYYDESNAFIKHIIDHWPVQLRTYSVKNGATPYFPTGDSRTGLPFLLNHVDSPDWFRVWAPTVDDEVVALDIVFPKQGHNKNKPIYLVFHGMNGGSDEKYVQDLANRRNQDGSTVAVMVARGLMDLPVRGWNVFHGARVDDAHVAAKALRMTLGKHQILAGVGYSMGAIILANYVARSGAECALDAAISISGGLDMRKTIDDERAKRLWQPIVAHTLRKNFVVGKFGERYRKRLTKEQMLSLLRAPHVTSVDEHAIVNYNGFDNVTHYYSEMSAMGDVAMEESTEQDLGRISSLSIPLCVLHALDDPVITWMVVASNVGARHPENLVKTGTGNLIVLLTTSGGHVGWPMGWYPATNKWKWMNDAAKGFVEAVAVAKAEDYFLREQNANELAG